MKLYIVLFKDGAMMPLKVKPKADDFQADTRFFETEDHVTLNHLSAWYANSNKLEGFFKETA